MRILVTGGCGFIGSHLVEYHLSKGDEVYVVDDLSSGRLQNIFGFKNNPSFQCDEANILTWPNLKKAVAWADRIYHMAAVVGVFNVLANPTDAIAANILSCEKLLRAVSESDATPRILIASSSEVYGQSPKLLLNENDNLLIESVHPRWNYAISKLADEALGIAYHKTKNIPITILRLFNTIGPRQTGHYGMVVPRFIQQACHDEAITVFGDGTQTRSFCDVRDLVCALDLLAKNLDTVGEVVNVGHDEEIPIYRLAELIRIRANSQSIIQYVPYHIAYGEEFIDIKQRRPDLTKFFQFTAFKYQWTLIKTIDDLIVKYRHTMMVS